MGHANVSNISRTFNRMLHARDGVSIDMCVDELERTKQTVHASEGPLPERHMLAAAAIHIVAILFDAEAITPMELTRKQQHILKEWRDPNTDFFEWNKWDVLDAIRWHPVKKRLPVIRYWET
jgi:hypothetical protein